MLPVSSNMFTVFLYEEESVLMQVPNIMFTPLLGSKVTPSPVLTHPEMKTEKPIDKTTETKKSLFILSPNLNSLVPQVSDATQDALVFFWF